MQRSCGKRERLLFKELKKLVGLEAGGGCGGVVVISFSELRVGCDTLGL